MPDDSMYPSESEGQAQPSGLEGKPCADLLNLSLNALGACYNKVADEYASDGDMVARAQALIEEATAAVRQVQVELTKQAGGEATAEPAPPVSEG